ncbi:MAG: DNA repair protein RecN [Candidatus Cloacimonetes bacterium]|nr:DNA repair protein RecN [Candidatus Cloacimonadota bacterium]
MLSEIYIKNYILVPELRLPLGKGLTAITGETGAGKSILAGSISLIFGESAAGIEPYTQDAPIYLEATFIPPEDIELQTLLTEYGHIAEEELILAREISPSGKSAYFLDGRKIGAAAMKALKPPLIDFHHQRDQQKILSPAYQLELLDSFAGSTELCQDFGHNYREYKRQSQELSRLIQKQKEAEQKLELYRYQYAELESAQLKEDEDRQLEREYQLQSHSREISEIVAAALAALFDSEASVFDILSNYQAQLSRYESLNPLLAESSTALGEAKEALRTVQFYLSGLQDSLSFDPALLESISQRLDQINELLHKHKAQNLNELFGIFQTREREIAAADDLDEQIHTLQKELEERLNTLNNKADSLSEVRNNAARQLSAELQKSIRFMALKEASIQIVVDRKSISQKVLHNKIDSYSDTGQDSVEILFAANCGSEAKPLALVASGGELSRILLGIKQVLAQKMTPRLLILDEIDSGVGGKTAELMADAISVIARRHPVLCITHLAQIAAKADTHIAVEKLSGTRSEVSLNVLDAGGRTHELARMLSGNITQHALKHAEELQNKHKKKEDCYGTIK